MTLTVDTEPASGLDPRDVAVDDGSWRGAYWQHVVLSRVALARDDLHRVSDGRTCDTGLAQVDQLLKAATKAATQRGSRLRIWLGGSAINHAFVNLHAAQVLLAKYAPADRLDGQLRSAMVRLRATLPVTAERRRELESHYRRTTDQRQRGWILEKALEWSYAATDSQYARLRSFRNIISGVSIAVLGLAIGLAVLGFVWPEAIRLCFETDNGQACPTGSSPLGRDSLVIEVLGAAGGALAAVLAVRKMQGTSTPYSVPLALAMLKLPFGALSALLGLVLVHGQFIPGLTDLDSPGQILAYAIAFGVAQHAVTVLVDRRGEELLTEIPGKRSSGHPHGTAAAELHSSINGKAPTVGAEKIEPQQQ
ncbi:hypothetical protein AB0M20_13175 [Actinoplanes sp. NPDC051633]|uniref:hypothetical protein n=1 Tax=Actinoplanes sp. NPDC051633 TaxID=3155670 RepID=UPI003435A02E